MATTKLNIRGTKNPSPILIRFTNGRGKGNSFYVKSGYYCNPNYFNNKKGEVKRVAEFGDKQKLQNNLDSLILKINKSLNDSQKLDKSWLENIVSLHHGISKENKDFTLIDWVEKLIEYKLYGSENPISDVTVKSYRTTINRVKAFEGFKKTKYRIEDLNSDFREEFIKWARKEQAYQPKTFSKTLKQLESVCRYAILKKALFDDSFLTSKTPLKKTKQLKEEKFPILTFEEINKLIEFKGKESLENVRDWLVISCWIGARIQDLMGLSKNNITTTITGTNAIKYVQSKTNRTVEVPIHYHIKVILENRNGFPRKISHQKYNTYIKELCKLCEINEVIKGSKMINNRKKTGEFPKYELITSHIGRRSFATNHFGKISTSKIMLITGHNTITQFLEYIGRKDNKHHEDFYNLWDDLEKSTNNYSISKTKN